MSKLLITGGTGSFGNALLKKYIDNKTFDEIRIFSRDEKKQDDLRKKVTSKNVTFYIGDIRDPLSIEQAMIGVDYIFHAAALKQVPSCEFFPIEAVKTNILGTDNLLTQAKRNNVKKVIVLSTDKAAYPINAMGMSKALMEKVMISNSRTLQGSNTIFCGTRYGNVMASRGSVIPLFINQIKSGKDITVTHPKMTRFLMNLNSAVELVMYAFKNAKNGDIFVQKSPSATVENIAKALIELYKSKSKIKYIGIRHGEKMHETLVTREEMKKSEDLGKYFKIHPDSRDLNYEAFYSKGSNDHIKDEYNSSNTEILDLESLKNLLISLPEISKDLN